MTFDATIKIKDLKLYECLLPEQQEGSRSSMRVAKTADNVTIKINAKDAVALRAEFNSLGKLLVVNHKIEKKLGK